jgi:hypothetical protein
VTIRAGQPFNVGDGPVTWLTQEMIAAASQRIYDEMAALQGDSLRPPDGDLRLAR